MGDTYANDAADEVLFWMAGEGRMGRKVEIGLLHL